MKFQFEKLKFSNLLFIFPLVLTLLSFGCNQPQTTITTNTNAVATSATPEATATATPAQPEQQAATLPVTLPVLDAMFADENFAKDLKSKLQLTDEQIEKLKSTAHQAVGNLKEDAANAGSTRAATERSGNQIREILGDEKTNKLFQLVSQRWNGGDEAGNTVANSNAKMNAVPTDTRVVVNAPAYRMDLFQDGKLVKTYKIGIGYPEFPLPSGMRKANTIIFNPTWTPPDEPWVEGSNKVKVGEKVAAGDKLNPLGPIKIPIGLPSLIHGGKSPAKLGGFASHGCVGLTNGQVQDFALNLAKLSGTQLLPDDVKNYEKQKTETKDVKLDKTVPVELRYETIVVEDGKLKIFRDVYEKGTNTEENLRAVLQNYGVSFDNLKPQDRQKIIDGLKQMAIDATGQPVETGGNLNNKNSNNQSNTNSKSNDNSKNVPITRTVKGKKELSFDVAELKGKGYPSPVNLSQQ
ncbi:MAG: L,D-transpeptidase [Acidobacteriota bacterium]|nr:L,D-transpeptidase [Acidobacteriota bacterium]